MTGAHYPTGEDKAYTGSAAAIRVQVDATLARRVPAALSLKSKQTPELFSSGIADVNAMLGGGIPRSSITEVSGTASTGKTSFALSGPGLHYSARQRLRLGGLLRVNDLARQPDSSS